MSISKFVKKEFLFTVLPASRAVYTCKQVKEHGFYGALKKELKETPGIDLIYKKGKEEGIYEGKKQGYFEASNEYENKLLALSKKFKEQSDIFMKNSNAKDILMKEYETYIEEQEKIIDKLSKEKRKLLYIIKNEYNEIKDI